MKKIPHDIIGSIAILKFPKKTLWITKKLKARQFLKKHENITTALEKTEKITGRLRKITTKHLAGKRTKETIHKENGCEFNVDIDTTYFSPRLSQERKEIAERIKKLAKKKKTNILVMFAGIAPYPIILAKKLKREKKEATIISNEINREANKQAKKNIEKNKVQDMITIIRGDAKKLPEKISKKFDIILMTRPNLQETFIQTALKLTKKGTTIIYHGFGTKEKVLTEIKKDAEKKIGRITIQKAGDIAPKEYRWRAEFKVK